MYNVWTAKGPKIDSNEGKSDSKNKDKEGFTFDKTNVNPKKLFFITLFYLKNEKVVESKNNYHQTID